MTTVTTRSGKTVDIISQADLRDPLDTGIYVRAYCHFHGSDHQRSLSINKASGWGHCFNAACQRLVLVSEWNPTVAAHLLHRPEPLSNQTTSLRPDRPKVRSTPPPSPLAQQPVLLHEPKKTPKWQQEELRTLIHLEKRLQNSLERTPLVHSYLRGRGIPLEIAQLTGVGYLPPELPATLEENKRHWTLRRWAGRISFPLITPGEQGFIGRTLRHWRPGMDENAHKKLLDRPGRPRRWTKTNPAGWFCCTFEQFGSSIILVEGTFDRLALLTAGFEPYEVVALAGTSVQADWFPPQVKTIVLALDGDEGGQEASSRMAEQLALEGLTVLPCPPPQDGQGKDWNERWRKLGLDGLSPLWETYSISSPP
ncbi:MAG: toprim domain-containing protein [Ktedonobacteraceae bacterium]|nr:toprim domain-containing protein [Ktedonobacteraceae bacterium]